MGDRRGLHPEWDGFTPIRNEAGTIIKAYHPKCGKKLTKRDQKALRIHKLICKGITDDKNKETNKNNDETLDQSQNFEESKSETDFALTRDDSNASDNSMNSQNLPRSLSSLSSDFEKEQSDYTDAPPKKKYHVSNDVFNMHTSTPKSENHSSRAKASLTIQAKTKITDQSSLRRVHEERSMTIVKFCLFNDISLSKMELQTNIQLINELLPAYEIPAANELEKVFLKKAGDAALKQCFTKNHSETLHLITYEDENILHALTILGTVDTEPPSYIDFCSFEKASTNYINVELSSFCDQSVRKVSMMHRIDVRFLYMFNNQDLKFESSVLIEKDKTVRYYRINPFQVTLQKLINIKINVILTNENIDFINKYHATLQTLKEKSYSGKIPLAEGVQMVLDLADYAETANNDLSNEILNCLDGASLTANFLNPKYHGQSFIDNNIIYQKVKKFLMATLPTGTIMWIPYYEKKDGDFFDLFHSSSKDDWLSFWDKASMINRDLSKYALELLRLPLGADFNVNQFVKCCTQYNDHSDRFKNLIVTLFSDHRNW